LKDLATIRGTNQNFMKIFDLKTSSMY